MFMSNCTKEEVAAIVAGLDNNKASDIAIPILKQCSLLILDHLVKFFNFFLETGLFPAILKTGSITPVFKKGDSRYLDNYRPVSTLPVFGKNFGKNNLWTFI